MVNTRIFQNDSDWAQSDAVAVFVNSTPHIPKSKLESHMSSEQLTAASWLMKQTGISPVLPEGPGDGYALSM